MASRRQAVLLALSLGTAAALVTGLFLLSGLSLADLVRIVGATPPGVLTGIVALTLANQFLSVARWRFLSDFFSPTSRFPSWSNAVRATLRGAFAGQLVPLQLAMPLARWASVRKAEAVKATLYEQLFDTILLGCCGLAAIALFAFAIDPASAAAFFAAALMLTVAATPLILRMASLIACRFSQDPIRCDGAIDRFAEVLAQASRLPPSLLVRMAALSSVRLAILGLRTVIVVAIAAPAASPVLVGLGYPVVGLALGAPFLPAGLGLADWSLAGVVVVAGGTASAAAAAALALRILTFGALALLLIGSEALRIIERGLFIRGQAASDLDGWT